MGLITTKKHMATGEPIRVTISQAANLFGVSQKTIRRAIQNQELLYIVVRGVYKINFESLLKWSQNRATTQHKLANTGIGQYVDKWKIKNKLFSPNPKAVKKTTKTSPEINVPLPENQPNTENNLK